MTASSSSSTPRKQVTLNIPSVTPYITYAVIVLLVAGFVATAAIPDLLASGGLAPFPLNYQGEYFRLPLSLFLHTNLAHLLVNIFVLYRFGTDQERIFGYWRYGLILLLGGLAGAAFGSLLPEDVIVRGASSAVCAMLGAELVYLYQHRKLLGAGGRMRRNLVIGFLAAALVVGVIYSAGSHINVFANWTPLAGLIGGAVLAWFLAPVFNIVIHPERREEFRAEDINPLRGNKPITIISLYMSAVILVLMLGRFLSQP